MERLRQVRADKAICLEERSWTEEVTKTRYVTETRYRTKYRSETVKSTSPYKYDGSISGYSQSGRYFWSRDGRNGPTILRYGSKSCSINGLSRDRRSSSWTCGNTRFIRGSLVESDYPYYHYKIAIETTETRQVPYQEAYTVQVPEEYQETVVIKTDNYDYCVDMGYETAS